MDFPGFFPKESFSKIKIEPFSTFASSGGRDPLHSPCIVACRFVRGVTWRTSWLFGVKVVFGVLWGWGLLGFHVFYYYDFCVSLFFFQGALLVFH